MDRYLLQLTFKASDHRQFYGPVAGLRLVANALHVNNDNNALATLDRSTWSYGGHHYSRVECRGFMAAFLLTSTASALCWSLLDMAFTFLGQTHSQVGSPWRCSCLFWESGACAARRITGKR